MVESEAWKLTDDGSHSILYVEKIGFNLCIEKPFEKRAIEESDIAVCAHTGSWELVRVTDHQYFLHSCLQSD